MSNIILLSLEQLTEVDLPQFVMDFAKALNTNMINFGKIAYDQGGLTLEYYKPKDHAERKAGVIHKYKVGEIDEDTFFTDISNIFSEKNIEPIEKEKFWKQWNSYCNMSEKSINKLKELEKLQKETGIKIHVFADIDKHQLEYIQKQLKENEIDLDINFVCSFENKERNSNNLRQIAIDNLKSQFAAYTILDFSENKKIDVQSIRSNLPGDSLIFSSFMQKEKEVPAPSLNPKASL